MASLKSLVDIDLIQIPPAYIRPEHERRTASQIYTENVPLIDLKGFHVPDRADLVDAISKACQQWGFFQVLNYIIVIDSTWNLFQVLSNGRFHSVEHVLCQVATEHGYPFLYFVIRIVPL